MTSREKFEAWYLENWGHTEDDHETLFERDPDSDEEYYRLGVRLAWESWQAASKASEQKLEESRREFRSADATIHNLELKFTDMAVQLANAESKCRELAAAMNHITELQSQTMNPVAWMRSDDITTFGPIFTKNKSYAVDQWGENAVALYTSPVNFKLACFTDERNLKYINERGRDTSLIWSERNSEDGDIQLFRAADIGVKGE